MLLKAVVPEVFRKVLLADEESRIRRLTIAGKGQGEGYMGLRTIRPFGFALKKERLIAANSLLSEPGSIGSRIRAAQNEHRNALPIPQIIPHESSKAEATFLMRLDSTSVIAYSNQLHKRGAELNDAIFRAPRMPIAGTNLKSETAIHVRGSIEIANRNDNVINMAHEKVCSDAGKKWGSPKLPDCLMDRRAPTGAMVV